MNILSDLDPKNARIQHVSENHYMARLLAVLLLLGGTTWLYFAAPFELARSPSPTESTAATSLPIHRDGAQQAQVPATTPGITASGYAKQGPASIQSAAAATSVGQTSTLGQANALQGLQREAATTESAKDPDSLGTPAASKVTPPVPESRKHSTKDVSAKAGTLRKNQSIKSARAQHPAKGATMASERDIEIISAIVR